MNPENPSTINDSKSRSGKRQATVYDAVAGHVGANGIIPKEPFASKYRDTVSSSMRPVPPEEVLFKSRKAPVRYEENDFYFANEHLRNDQRLPDSELLQAIHQYSSDFYSKTLGNRAQPNYRSMNETALIAMGILLEEAMLESLGENGDMTLAEPEGHSQMLHESPATRALVHGSVPIPDSPKYTSESDSDDIDVGHPSKKIKSDHSLNAR